MTPKKRVNRDSSALRRDFLKNSTLAMAAAVAAPAVITGSSVAASDPIKVGLIGCGPRGISAALQAMNVDKGVRVTALADIFEERLRKAHNRLKEKNPAQSQVKADHEFIGLDAYKKVIATGIDVAIIANASRFHTDHFEACVEAGVHTFVEKPACMDAPSFKQVLSSTEKAKAKGLSVVSGQMWRYDPKIQETVKRIHDGRIGDIVAIQLTTMRDNFQVRNRPEGMNEMHYQLFNWTHFSYLSGDFLPKSLVHHSDLASWIMHEEQPASAFGCGGRAAAYGPAHGDCFDHNSVVYEYKNRQKLYAALSLQPNCYSEVSDIIMGTKGRAYLQRGIILGEKRWRYQGENSNAYQNEQTALIRSMLDNKPLNNGHYMATAAMAGIVGQMAVYTGQKIKWDDAVQTGHVFGPASDAITMDGEPPVIPLPDGTYSVPIPGNYKLKG